MCIYSASSNYSLVNFTDHRRLTLQKNAMKMQEMVDTVVHALHDKKLLLSKALYVAHIVETTVTQTITA
jgi:hypothetical protein